MCVLYKWLCFCGLYSSVEDGLLRWLGGEKNLPSNVGDIGDARSSPGLGRSPGGGNGRPLQYSSLEIPWTEEPMGLQSIGLQRVEHD